MNYSTSNVAPPWYILVGICGSCGGKVVIKTITTTGTNAYQREWCLACGKIAKPPSLPVREMI